MWNIPLTEGEVRPEQKLAAVVLMLALDDANSSRPARRDEALRWINEDSPDLALWCEIAGTTMRALREHLAFRCGSGNGLRTRRCGSWTSARRAAQVAKEMPPGCGSRGKTRNET